MTENSVAKHQLSEAIEDIEEAYEFLLAYASKGVGPNQGSGDKERLEEFLLVIDDRLEGIDDSVETTLQTDIGMSEEITLFVDSLRRDIDQTRALIDIVLAFDHPTPQAINMLNGLAPVQSTITKLFFLQELLE